MTELIAWAMFVLGGFGGWAIWQVLVEHRVDLSSREQRNMSSARGFTILSGMRPSLYDDRGRRLLPLMYTAVIVQLCGVALLVATVS